MEIECRNLSFGYIKQPLLFCGVNFSLGSGKRAILISPKDHGKTSFLKVLCGLEDLYFGNILFDKINLKATSLKDIDSSLILNPPVLENRKTVLENLLKVYYTKEKILLGRTLKCKERKIVKNAKNEEIVEKMAILLPKIDTNCKIHKLIEAERLDVNIVRSLLKNPHNVFIDDIDKIENSSLLKSLIEKKTLFATATKPVDFGFDFDKVFYLSFGKFYKYNSYQELKKDRVNLSVCYMFDDLVKVNAKLVLDESGFIVYVDDKKYKFTDNVFKKLEKLKMELYDESEVVFVHEQSEQNIFDLLDKGDVNMYETLTEEKIF